LRKEYLGLKIFAVILAALLWLQAALLSDHRAVINIPIQLTNAPKDVSIDKNQDSIPYIVEGKGIDILRFALSKTRISVDASNIRPGFDLLALNDYKVEVPVGINLNLIGPANAKEISVKAESFQQKNVPVELSFRDKYTENLLRNKRYKLQPEKVEIYGSGRLLRNIESIKTQEITPDMLNRSQVKLDLLNPQREITISDKTTLLLINNRQTEDSVIRTVSLVPTDMEKYFPNKITIKLSGDPALLSGVTEKDLIASVDPAPGADGSYKVIVKVPAGLTLVAITPEKVRPRS